MNPEAMTTAAHAFYAVVGEEVALQYPVEAAMFRQAFGIAEAKEPLGPLVPGRRITMPTDDPLYELCVKYKELGAIADHAAKDRKAIRKQVTGPMGEASEILFSDGSTAVRRQVTRPAHEVAETKYEELRVTIR